MKLVMRSPKEPKVTRFIDIRIGDVFEATYKDCSPTLYMVIEVDGERRTLHLSSGGTLRQFRPEHPVVAVDAELHWSKP